MHQIIVDCIATLLTALVFWVWSTYVKPWLLEHHLAEAALIAVRAAEAVYGRYHGQDKLDAALKHLADAGWDINDESVIYAIKAAWQKMNSEQISAGEKDNHVTSSSVDETDTGNVYTVGESE